MKPSLPAVALCALLFSSLAAAAVELPVMKPGQWQTTMKRSTGNPQADKPWTMSTCLDTKTQAEAKQTAADYAKKNCSKNETRREGDKWVTDMVCSLDGSRKMITHSESTFQGDDAYHTEMTTTFEPAKAGHAEDHTVVDGKFLGACKAK
jgi:hypothetical protein